MSLLREFMRIYQYLFHPGVVLAVTLLLLVYREWATDRTHVRSLVVRIGTLLGVELVAVVPLAVYLLVRKPPVTRLTAGSDWRINLVTAVSLLVGGALLWYVWSANSWGATVSTAGVAVSLTAVPYALVAPVWNVSGHVTFTLVPTLLLALSDRRFWPLLSIPTVMVLNRPVLGAHTWLQSLGGLALGTVGVLAAVATSSRA
ncbi:phosphoesterase [Halorussus salinisoli]|uniref:phosphoesterase n=1 Tax=Halorussus salinisoli TaxID=2558242 RepID=UPI0010C1A810|nr:phosphoesterase [Halorussus salinisoli]